MFYIAYISIECIVYTRENQETFSVYPGIASHCVGVAKLYLIRIYTILGINNTKVPGFFGLHRNVFYTKQYKQCSGIFVTIS